MRSLARFTYLRAGALLLAAAAAVAIAAPFALQAFDEVQPFDISDPDSEVERAYSAYESATGQRAAPEVLVLVSPERGADSRSGRKRVEEVAQELDAIPGIAAVTTPDMRPELTSDDGSQALVAGTIEAGANRVDVGEDVSKHFDGDPDVVAGGTAVAAYEIGVQTEEDTRRIELYAAPVLLLLLLLVFRSPLAAALPLVLAGFSILICLALLTALAQLIDIDLFSLQVVTGLGVGLAIDYSLLVLARYRSELRAGGGYQRAQLRTMLTAGRTVAFGALTVAAALAALIVFPQQFLSSTGIAGALVALLSGIGALVVLPAVLSVLGPRIDPGLHRAPSPAQAPPDPLSGGSRFWRGLSRFVMRWPLPVATLALAAMLAIGSPALDGKLTTPDARVLPADRGAKVVADAIANDFHDVSENQMAIIVPADADQSQLVTATAELGQLGIARVEGPQTLPDGTSYFAAVSPLDPLADEGQDLLKEVRAIAWPEGTTIGGRAAELADQRSSIRDHTPLVVAIVVVTNMLLVLIMVRSLILPLVSVALNALTVIASYGIMVLLFEHQRTAELLGTMAQDGIDVSVPVLAFAVVFGLSTDYGIFLFSRIAEARRGAASEQDAITDGLARTGRLISSAAVIFAVAVGANAFSDLVNVKELAVAVAAAVLLDATIVRGLLAPALLRMLGRAAWWPGQGAES